MQVTSSWVRLQFLHMCYASSENFSLHQQLLQAGFSIFWVLLLVIIYLVETIVAFTFRLGFLSVYIQLVESGTKPETLSWWHYTLWCQAAQR